MRLVRLAMGNSGDGGTGRGVRKKPKRFRRAVVNERRAEEVKEGGRS